MAEHTDEFPFYKEHPKTCAPDDFWGQVKRSIAGKPVGEDQIDLIVRHALNALQLNGDDVVLDICCGNGALSDRIFAACSGGLGVDFSEALIGVADLNFSAPPVRTYRLSDVEEFLRKTQDTDRFTKAFCYGAFQYLPKSKAEEVLKLVHARFPRIGRMFIGELPDKDRMRQFFGERVLPGGIEDDPGAPIGIWRTQSEFGALADRCGWAVSLLAMPPGHYAAHYRYDAVLSRAPA